MTEETVHIKEDDLLTIKELASYFKVNVKTVIEWKAKDYGPKRIKIGRKTFFRGFDVINWIESRTGQ